MTRNKNSKGIIVPRHRKDSTGKNQREGLSAEKQFRELCLKNGWVVRQATKAENYKQHIDCWVIVNNMAHPVDVKAAKRIARRDNTGNFSNVQDAYHWVEWTGRAGHKGWVRGKAEFIAFGMLSNSFLMVRRDELMRLTEKLISLKKNIMPQSQFDCINGVLWRRHGNLDQMTLIPTETLKSLRGTWILK